MPTTTDHEPADAAIEARAPRRMPHRLDEMLVQTRRRCRSAHHFRFAAIVMGHAEFDQLRYEVHPGLSGFGTMPLLTADGEYRGHPIECLRAHIGLAVVLPGDERWPAFVAAQGRRLATLALRRFPTTTARSLPITERQVRDQPSLELAMVKIAERIGWG